MLFRSFDSIDDLELHNQADTPKEKEPEIAQNFSQQSTNPNPTIQEPQQVRMPNGVPVWELYDRDTGSVLHAVADHTHREAWGQAQTWLRSVGAESPETFSERFGIRPRLLSAGERNLSPTVRETVDPVSGRGAVAPTPQVKKPTNRRVDTVTPAAKVNITRSSTDPKAQTYSRVARRVFEEFDSYFESVITPAKKRLK